MLRISQLLGIKHCECECLSLYPISVYFRIINEILLKRLGLGTNHLSEIQIIQ